VFAAFAHQTATIQLLWLWVSTKNEVDPLFRFQGGVESVENVGQRQQRHFRANLHRLGQEIMHASVDIEMPSRLNFEPTTTHPPSERKSQEKPGKARGETAFTFWPESPLAGDKHVRQGK